MKKLIVSMMVVATLSGCASDGGLSDTGKVMAGIVVAVVAAAGSQANSYNQQSYAPPNNDSYDSQVAREMCLERLRVTNTVGHC